ncbi:MAG TPA: hypothetical protein VN326_16850 [Casimicrobiaceae bacterium]|nr:hypothetical protein [Casimicrobiaceae bacterium]
MKIHPNQIVTDIPYMPMGNGFLRLAAKGLWNTLDGKGCWVDNAFVERLSRGVKHGEVRLCTCATPSEANTALERCFRLFKAYEILSNQLGPPLCP